MLNARAMKFLFFGAFVGLVGSVGDGCNGSDGSSCNHFSLASSKNSMLKKEICVQLIAFDLKRLFDSGFDNFYLR